jgi:hypothetical protein
MSEENTQAAVDEPKVPAQPGAEATNAQAGDDLDALLSEFDTETRPSTPAQPATAAPAANDVKDASAEVLAARDEIRKERFQKDIKVTVSDIRGDLPADLYDDDFMESWLDVQAKKDERLAQAWANRNANPQQFAKVKAALGKEFAKKYGKLPDRQATDDREAVTAAVRGASTRAPEGKAPNYAGMTNADFAAEKDRAFGD